MRRGKLRSLLAAIGLAAPALAGSSGGYSMEVLLDGRPLAELPHGGRTYVEASRGREYAVRLSNHTDARVAVALAVDGLNSIDAKKTASRAASKWILEPWESIVIEGWQTSGSTARRFFFTTEDRSYGAWLGKTADLGIISAAFFRERPQHAYEQEHRNKDAQAPSAAAPSDDMAATGIGREVDHRVRRVSFDEEPHPAAVLDVRYEYRDALVKLGVLPRPRPIDDPLARRERARGFEDTGFAPDPYRYR